MRTRASERACERAWRAAQCAASTKKEHPAKKRVGTLNRKNALCVLRDHRGRWKRRVRSCIKERGAVCVLWCKEDRGQRERCVWHWQRGPRGAGAARVALRAQQHCSCVMIVSPSRLWVRAQAGAWMLAVCEDERDGNAAEDGGVD